MQRHGIFLGVWIGHRMQPKSVRHIRDLTLLQRNTLRHLHRCGLWAGGPSVTRFGERALKDLE